jgi:hydroxymethylbilane synthase
MTTSPIRIATRGSPLALWQANHIADKLRALDSRCTVELVIIQTQGDQVRDRPLSQIGGDGLFTKAIQEAILDGRADVAVHSLKDLPTAPVSGLILAAVPPRGPIGDVFISHRFKCFNDLPAGSRIATGSMRRKAQVRYHRPDLELIEIRGNVDTRLRKLRETELDGLIMAQAGLERLGLRDAITEILDRGWMLPAVGQGALGLECRTDDKRSQQALAALDDAVTHSSVRAERSFLMGLGGGCIVPIGASTEATGNRLTIRGVVLSPDGKNRITGDVSGDLSQADELGVQLAAKLAAEGAKELLARK